MHQVDLTLAGAIAAGGSGDLHDWLQAFLRSDAGLNASLADRLEELRPQYDAPARIELERLVRITGPEPGINWHMREDQWEADVAAKVASLENGWAPPPLIANSRDLALWDGNRRHEALVRSGQTTYWTIVFT